MNKDNLNKNNFKVPENYFDDLQDKLFLNSLENENNFNVPQDYFENLELNILKETEQVDFKGSKKKMFPLSYWFAAASVLIVVLLSVEFILINKEKTKQHVAKTKIEKEVYQKIYDSFIEEDQNTKSSNITLDDSDYVLYNY